MRKILFRGKRKDNRKWVEGFFVSYGKESYIFEQSEVNKGIDLGGYLGCCQMREVYPKTVSEFLEVEDKNRKRIFEGDVIRKTNEGRHAKIFVACRHCGFPKKEEVYYGPFEHFTESIDYEVLGNKWDNPELLEGK